MFKDPTRDEYWCEHREAYFEKEPFRKFFDKQTDTLVFWEDWEGPYGSAHINLDLIYEMFKARYEHEKKMEAEYGSLEDKVDE